MPEIPIPMHIIVKEDICEDTKVELNPFILPKKVLFEADACSPIDWIDTSIAVSANRCSRRYFSFIFAETAVAVVTADVESAIGFVTFEFVVFSANTADVAATAKTGSKVVYAE